MATNSVFCPAFGTPFFYRGTDSADASHMIDSFDATSGKPLPYEFGMESRAEPLAAPGWIDARVTEDLMPQEAARVRSSNRQYRPG